MRLIRKVNKKLRYNEQYLYATLKDLIQYLSLGANIKY